MIDFKVDDIIEIIDQPKNGSTPNIIGCVGFIEEMRDDYALITILNPDGKATGSGSVSLYHIKLSDSYDAMMRKQKYDNYLTELLAKSASYNEFYQDRRDDAIRKACLAAGISIANAVKIFDIYEEFISNIDGLRS